MKIFILFVNLICYSKFVSSCTCRIGDLEEIERLNKEIKRIRIEHPNGLEKLPDNLPYSSTVDCNSVVLYVTNEIEKKCRSCTKNGWSELKFCEINRCDRDLLPGQPILKTFNSKLVPTNQTLFSHEQVKAVYKYSKKESCKICQLDGEWSRHTNPNLCRELTSPRLNKTCKFDELKKLDFNQLEYIRIHMETSHGLKIYPHNIKDNKLPPNTIVVYQRYLSALANMQPVRQQSKNYYPSYPFTKKFCRYCENGVWSDMESCVSLNCDKDLLTGSPQLVMSDRSLRPVEQQVFFRPYSAIAVYFFGNDKFCKQCHENGEWSKYSLGELCKIELNNEIQIKKKFRINKDLEELYKKETKCNLTDLKIVENQYSTVYTRVLFVSPDRKHSYNPELDAKIPSRTLSIYQISNSNSSKHYCSICINGIWSEISEQCSTDSSLYFCHKEKLTSESKNILFELNDNSQAQDTQNLFEPGSVMAVYELSETSRICKICEFKEEKAKWSQYAEAYFCSPNEAFSKGFERSQNLLKASLSCRVKDLESIEDRKYTRQSIQSWDARSLENGEFIAENSVAVYQSNSENPSKSNIKWCRKCSKGAWTDNYYACPIEFSINKCDPSKLRGVNYFVYVSDGLRVSEEEKDNLIFPGKVMAIYEFGFQKYCKACNEDGTWTSYPQYQLCNQINWLF